MKDYVIAEIAGTAKLFFQVRMITRMELVRAVMARDVRNVKNDSGVEIKSPRVITSRASLRAFRGVNPRAHILSGATALKFYYPHVPESNCP